LGKVFAGQTDAVRNEEKKEKTFISLFPKLLFSPVPTKEAGDEFPIPSSSVETTKK